MSFVLAPLPFANGALGEFMSAETLSFHHGRHHKAYVDRINLILERRPLPQISLVRAVRWAHQRGDNSLFNNSAQAWNHNFFWRCLAPATGQKPAGRLAELIDESYGSVEKLFLRMTDEAAGHFSNGWVWLLHDRGRLRITSLHDADTPLVHKGMQPLLTIDVWEHAYYLDYRNARTSFIEKVLANIIDWEFVAQNLDGRGEVRADQEQITQADERFAMA